MSDIKIIEIKDQHGNTVAWSNVDEIESIRAWEKEMHNKWVHGLIFGFPKPSEEEEYLRGIRAVITEERRMVFQHDDGTFYEIDEETPTLKIPLVKINEKLTVIRGATGFDF